MRGFSHRRKPGTLQPAVAVLAVTLTRAVESRAARHARDAFRATLPAPIIQQHALEPPAAYYHLELPRLIGAQAQAPPGLPPQLLCKGRAREGHVHAAGTLPHTAVVAIHLALRNVRHQVGFPVEAGAAARWLSSCPLSPCALSPCSLSLRRVVIKANTTLHRRCVEGTA